MTFLIVANFKSHKTVTEVKEWVAEVAPAITKAQVDSIVVAPAFPHLTLVGPSFIIGAQDVSPFPPGSYTGAVSATMLKDLGVQYAIVGHSERRRYFHETPNEVANKAKELLECGITPLICLSEEDIVPQRAALADDLLARCYFCFEPPSQIGGAETAPVGEIKQVTDLIREKYQTDRVMYGGSVNYDNITELLTLDLAGVLVAGGSLKAGDFIQLIKAINHGA